jgi:hypothetical protein
VLGGFLAGRVLRSPADYITGRVVSDRGPEAGVWVIAESFDVMPTDGRLVDTYRKIVVTDELGRFVIPQLPDGAYALWVRGYGLRDSKASWRHPSDIVARPGATNVTLEVEAASSPQEAALVYPASYWFSLLRPPAVERTPGESDDLIVEHGSEEAWVSGLLLNCNLCHQLGNSATRLTSADAFEVGIQKSITMLESARSLGLDSLVSALGDWGSRMRAGEVPEAPPRPQGVERNVVITQWEIGDVFSYLHDLTAVDRRNPESNPYGPVYLVDLMDDWLYTLDPRANSWERRRVPIHPNGTPVKSFLGAGDPAPAGHTSFRGISNHSFSRPHNPMLDEQGRVWMTTWHNGGLVPEFCPAGTGMNPLSLTVYDPESDEFEVIPTCFGTHHLEFGDDGILWTSGDGAAIGWFDPSRYDPRNPDTLEEAQGWSLAMMDSDGDGTGDTHITGFRYGVYPSPDGRVWSAVPGTPGHIERYDPESGTHEMFRPPYGSGPRGISVDSNGIVWTALAGSGHLARFDRNRCARTWGLGDQCPEGWTLWTTPGPTFQGFEPRTPGDNAGADMHYYVWVDRFNASGLGPNTIIVNGSSSDALLAFHQESETWSILRVPFPLNYYTRLLDARIDDADAGWKGRGIWSNYSSTTNLHTETLRPAVVHIQIRPDPLAY